MVVDIVRIGIIPSIKTITFKETPKNYAVYAGTVLIQLNINEIMEARFIKNYADTVPILCRRRVPL